MVVPGDRQLQIEAGWPGPAAGELGLDGGDHTLGKRVTRAVPVRPRLGRMPASTVRWV